MSQQIDPFTSAPLLWSEPTQKPDAQQQLADHLLQSWRNRHVSLAEHPELMATVARLEKDGTTIDLTKGQSGIDQFCDAVAAELQKPENNGRTGMLAEISDWQKENGFQ